MPRRELQLTWKDATTWGARMSEMKKFHRLTLSYWNRWLWEPGES